MRPVGTAPRWHSGSVTSFPYIAGPPQTPKLRCIKKNAANRVPLSHPQNLRYRSEGAWGSSPIPASTRAICLAGWYLVYIGGVWQSASPQKRGISGSCLVRSTPTNVPFGGGQVAHRYRWRISLPGRQGRPSHGPVLLGKAKRGKQFLNSDFLRA